MHQPKPVAVECEGKTFLASFVDFDVMDEPEFTNPLAHGELRIEVAGAEPIVVHYEEWAGSLIEGPDSRWDTGLMSDWNRELPDLSNEAVDAIHAEVDKAVYRRLRGSGWRTHL